MRGQFALNRLEEMPKSFPAQLSRKGRSEELIKRRNEVLLYRYYFYAKIKRVRYDDAIAILKGEFFLAERTTIDAITKGLDELNIIYKQQKSANELQKLFPFLNWKI